MYGEPYHRPSMRRRGKVMRYSSSCPSGRFTVSNACPICFTMIDPPLNDVFCPLWPVSYKPLLRFSMQYAVTGGWCDTCSTIKSVCPRPFLFGQIP